MKNLLLILPNFFTFHYYLFTYEILRYAQNDIFAHRLTSTEPRGYRVVFLYVNKKNPTRFVGFLLMQSFNDNSIRR